MKWRWTPALIAAIVAVSALCVMRGTAPTVSGRGDANTHIALRHAPVVEDGATATTDLAETCAVNSFTAGTLVLMADGSKMPIDQTKVGDMVMAGDPQKGTERGEPVKKVIVGQGLKHLVQLHVDGNVVNATYNHPFWSVTNQRFEWAQDLKVGEQVLLADGRAPPIQSIYKYDETTTVYNLSIQDVHTFYVGSAAVLVHNSCYDSFSARTFQTYTKTNPVTGEVYVGRTSGYGSPLENLARRDASHAYNDRGFGPAQLDQTSDSYAPIRGREQQLIEYYRGQGISANAINGISPLNPNLQMYWQAALAAFGAPG